VAMAKGGVGKTTTAVTLAHGLARLGHRVLLVDCDTQGQTAHFLGIRPLHGLFEFIAGQTESGTPLSKNETLYAARDNLWFLAGGIRLVELKNLLGEQPRDQRQTVLGTSLVPRTGSLDYLIFDCAPGWDVLSVNILMAAEEVICPVGVHAASLQGLKTFFQYLLSAQKLNPDLQLRYVLPTMFDRRTRLGRDILSHLMRLFKKQICDPIPYTVRLAEAPSKGQTIFEYDPESAGAASYWQFIRRVAHDGKQ